MATERLDDFFEQKVYPRQVRFSPIPAFSAHELFEKTAEKMAFFNEIVNAHEEEIPKATRTNVSQMEVIYPWLLYKSGQIGDIKERANDPGEYEQKAAIFGEKLHMADILFSIIEQDIRGVGAISQMMPTASEELVAKLDEATALVKRGKVVSPEDLETRHNHAWTNFHMGRRDLLDAHYNYNLPGFGMVDEGLRREILYSDELGDVGAMLAKARAKEYFNEEPMTWEFRTDVLTQREVLVSIKFTAPNLQFNVRFDSVTRILVDKKRGKVKAQSVDLKTGKRRTQNEFWNLADEINLRQVQVSQVMGEAFTARFLRGYKSLETKEGIFPMRANHAAKNRSKRLDKVGFRWFDKKTGEMEFEELKMTEGEREDFNQWFTWYGNMVNLHKEEIKRLIKRKPRFDLGLALRKDL